MKSEMNNNEKTSKKLEKKFGTKADFYRLLEGEEVLGSIVDLPVQSYGTLGRCNATVTNRRFIVESEINEKAKGDDKIYRQGRDLFYYETDLDKIESIKFFSSDRKSSKGNLALFLILIIVGIAICAVNFFVIAEKTKEASNIVKYGLYVVGAVVALFSIPFRKRSSSARNLQLMIYSESSNVEFSDNPEADVNLVVTPEVVEKMSLLAKGIRQAQEAIKK